MLEHIWTTKKESTDLNVYQCGFEDCTPSHSYGPAVRDHFLIHFIVKGRGIFKVGQNTYYIEKDQGFLICPNIVTYYQSDANDPWSYSWVGFNGIKAEYLLKSAGLSIDQPIFSYTIDTRLKEVLESMATVNTLEQSGELFLLGRLYEFLSLLISSSGLDRVNVFEDNRYDLYVKKTIEYIEKNFSRDININAISKVIGIDRSYLGSIFRKKTNMTPKEFLIIFRLNKGCELLKNSNLSISNISRSVGYDDPLLFSKMFKRVKSRLKNYFPFFNKERLAGRISF